MKSVDQPNAYLALDGMRGVGAMVVVIAHCYIFWGGLSFHSGPPVVDIFFLLSGFVIAFAYEPRFKAGLTTGTFMLQRLVRLFPLYLLGIAFGALVHLMAVMDEDPDKVLAYLGQLIPQLFLLPSPDLNGKGDVFAFNAPAWTLFFEFIINFAYIFAWPLLRSTRVLIAVVAACALWLAVSVFLVGHVDMGSTWKTFWGGFPRVAFGFFAGVLLFRIAGSPRTPETRISPWAIAPAALLPLIVLPNVSKEIRPWLDLLIVLAVAPALVGWARTLNPPRWLWKTFTVLGGMSYAMYILHFPVFEAVERLAYRYPQLSSEWAPWTGVVILAVVFLLSVAAERYYDQPVRAWLNAKLRARAAQRAPKIMAAE